MIEKRINLYDRLPEIYKIKDEEQQPPGQLKSYLALLEEAFSEIHKNIELSYYDHFVETCQDWVVPYIGDLLGNSHLIGDPWTLRADVADVIALRRIKGTLRSIERLTYNLTQWGVHCVELRENLGWSQHLNHQRSDAGGIPPYGLENFINNKSKVSDPAIRGGTVNLRDPALLSLIKTPFDPFAYLADLKPSTFGRINPNLPTLAIFLWRLKAYQVQGSKPLIAINPPTEAAGEDAKYFVRIQVHPLGEPVRLFNTHRFQFSEKVKPVLTPLDTLTEIDRTPGPILRARLTTDSPASNPKEYVLVTTYNENTLKTNESLKKSNVGLQIHMPQLFQNDKWSIRGADLCAWEEGLFPALRNKEVAIDPIIGRIVIRVDDFEEAKALKNNLLITYTYGAVGPVGAHPTIRSPLPNSIADGNFMQVEVNIHNNKTLKDALNSIQNSPPIPNSSPLIVEIKDSMIHDFDISSVASTIDENSEVSLAINRTVIIKASDNQRPIIRLAKPLRFRPTKVKGATEEEQIQLDLAISKLSVRLEGLYLTRADTFPPDEPLIARSALNSLEVVNCTLDPGGFRELKGSLAAINRSIELDDHHGFHKQGEDDAFKETPTIILQRTIAGPIFIGDEYSLSLSESILDAGIGDEENSVQASYAVSGNSIKPQGSWGPSTEVYNITVFGRMRVKRINGRGCIWRNVLEVLDNQHGCLKFSYFSGRGDRLPQNHGCVNGMQSRLRFESTSFGHQAYGQLAFQTDFSIKERGPNDNEMGAFGFLDESHKWHNIQIRFREFMPVGIKPILVPVT